jgi:hypothetical protein
MNNMAILFPSVILLGLGAPLTFDFWALFLKHAFKIAPSNICLVGRWLCHIPDGTLQHPNQRQRVFTRRDLLCDTLQAVSG